VKTLTSIIIPTLFTNIDYFQSCLDSLTKQKQIEQTTTTPIEIIITANTTQQLMEQAQNKLQPSLREQSSSNLTINWLCLGKNTGFTGAVNAGIKVAKGRYIILLNDDTIVDKNWLNELISTQQQTKADMVASKIYLSDKKTLDSQGFGFAWRGKAEPLDKNLQSSLSLAKDYWLNNPNLLPQTNFQEPFGPDAAAALYTRELFNKVGYFDNDFFAYLEDVDLALRARQAGMHCALAEKAIVYHYKHATTKKQKHSFKAKQDLKNWWKIVCRRYTNQVWLRFAGVILLERLKNLSGYLKSKK
jgi:GT2 family glycosyltransferase